MSNGNINKTKLKSSAAPSVRPKGLVQVNGADLAALPQAAMENGNLKQRTNVWTVDDDVRQLAHLLNKMHIWRDNYAPGPACSRPFISAALNTQTPSIYDVAVFWH